MKDWSIWVLEYAVAEHFPWSLSVMGAHNLGTHRAPFSYVVLKQGDHVVMVDVGHGSSTKKVQIAEDNDVTGWRDARTVLGQIGITPEQVADVIATHAHWDHFGNAEAFPNARFYLAKREINFWIEELTLPTRKSTFTGPIDPADLITAVELSAQGRIVLLDDEIRDLFPGIDVMPAWDTHTPGSIYVRATTSSGPVVLAGDNVYAWENLEGMDHDGVLRPVGLIVGSTLQAVKILDGILGEVGDDVKRVIPVHEDRLRHAYPSRTTAEGAMIVEVALAAGETSRLG